MSYSSTDGNALSVTLTVVTFFGLDESCANAVAEQRSTTAKIARIRMAFTYQLIDRNV